MSEDKTIRSTGRFLNMSWGKKKESRVKRKRYYFYIENPEFAENPSFPFKEGDTLVLEIRKNQVVISKGKVVIIPEE